MTAKIGRNTQCPCGSGLKYKNCCIRSRLGRPDRLNDQSASSPKIFSILTNAFLIIVVGSIVYQGSFSGQFFMDDSFFLDSPQVHRLWPIWDVIRDSNRPLLNLSFAASYVFYQDNAWGYHLFNLLVHILAALSLFGIVRRSLLSPRLSQKYSRKSTWMALIVSLLWMVHPLQTASVTYISQRAESLMGLFFLLTVYCSVRFMESSRLKWSLAAIISCALGLGVKEVIATAPLIVFIYDRAFFTSTFKELFSKRWKFYFGLILTWIIPFFLLTQTDLYVETAGLNFDKISPLAYAFTQPGVVLHYLKLSLYPVGLCFDYQWPLAQTIGEILPQFMAIGSLIIATLIAFRRHPEVGFLGSWFFIILSISSSFIPIADIAFEHRMYLSLAAVIVFIVFIIEYLLQRFVPAGTVRIAFASGLVLIALVCFWRLTVQRNGLYSNKEAMWRDVISKRPGNWRAYNSLGLALKSQGRSKEAMDYFQEAINLKPDYERTYNNIGTILLDQGQTEMAIKNFKKAIEFKPDFAVAENNLGFSYSKVGNRSDAVEHLRRAIEINPGYAEPYNNLGMIYAQDGDLKRAAEKFLRAIELKPHSVLAFNNLGSVFISIGDYDRSMSYSRRALEIEPNSVKAYYNLGVALKWKGKFKEAEENFRKTLMMNPEYPNAARNLSEVRARLAK